MGGWNVKFCWSHDVESCGVSHFCYGKPFQSFSKLFERGLIRNEFLLYRLKCSNWWHLLENICIELICDLKKCKVGLCTFLLVYLFFRLFIRCAAYVRTLYILRFVRWNFELAFKLNFNQTPQLLRSPVCPGMICITLIWLVLFVYCYMSHGRHIVKEFNRFIILILLWQKDLNCTSLGERKGQNDVVSTKGFAWHVLPDLESISPYESWWDCRLRMGKYLWHLVILVGNDPIWLPHFLKWVVQPPIIYR